MSDDYLFDRKGRDPAVEGLEDLLKSYRIDPITPKVSRARIIDLPGKRSSWFRLHYAVGFASVALVVVAAIASVRYIESSRTDYVANSPKESPAIDLPIPNGTLSVAIIDDGRELITKPPATSSAEVSQPAKLSDRVRPRPLVAKGFAAKGPKLTKQEKYAYDQLMVALWITGSKLKVVQDTIDRVDDEKAITTNYKR